MADSDSFEDESFDLDERIEEGGSAGGQIHLSYTMGRKFSDSSDSQNKEVRLHQPYRFVC